MTVPGANAYRRPGDLDWRHVTGKPTAVMQGLVRICPPGGVVLDPFAGSGTTGVAALLAGRRFAADPDARPREASHASGLTYGSPRR